jgi:hypothetical protein
MCSLAAKLEHRASGCSLLGHDLIILAAGEKDLGGTRGVLRELVGLRAIGRVALLPNGKPRYRFVGLFDNDTPGIQAVKAARDLDSSILEYKDVFRIWPEMPRPGNLDPGTIQRAFESANSKYKGLKWELEDYLSRPFMDAFFAKHPAALVRAASSADKVHWELTYDGKARLHRFVKANAVHQDMLKLIEALKSLRHCLNLSPNGIVVEE